MSEFSVMTSAIEEMASRLGGISGGAAELHGQAAGTLRRRPRLTLTAR